MATWLHEVTDSEYTMPPEPHAEKDSEQEILGNENQQASVTLRCPWNSRFAIYNNMLKYGVKWPYGGGGSLVASTITMRPAAGTNYVLPESPSINQYKEALLDVTFGVRGFQWGFPGAEVPGEPGQPRFTERIVPNGEFIKLNPKNAQAQQVFFWGAGHAATNAVTEDEAPTKLVIGYDYVLSWSGLPTPPPEVDNLIDHVNQDTVYAPSLNRTYAPETLLLTAVTVSHEVAFDDEGKIDHTYAMELAFSFRKNGWNKYWRAKTQAYEYQYIYDPVAETEEIYRNFPLAVFAGVLPFHEVES